MVLLQSTDQGTTLDLVAEGEGLVGEVGGMEIGTRTAKIGGIALLWESQCNLKSNFQRFRAAEIQVLSLLKPSFDLDWIA